MVDAAAKKITADADAYEKEVVIKADGALEQKLKALVEMNRDNAKALSTRAVPTNYFASGGASEKGGYDSEMINQLRLMNLNSLKTLNVDTTIQK